MYRPWSSSLSFGIYRNPAKAGLVLVYEHNGDNHYSWMDLVPGPNHHYTTGEEHTGYGWTRERPLVVLPFRLFHLLLAGEPVQLHPTLYSGVEITAVQTAYSGVLPTDGL